MQDKQETAQAQVCSQEQDVEEMDLEELVRGNSPRGSNSLGCGMCFEKGQALSSNLTERDSLVGSSGARVESESQTP